MKSKRLYALFEVHVPEGSTRKSYTRVTKPEGGEYPAMGLGAARRVFQTRLIYGIGSDGKAGHTLALRPIKAEEPKPIWDPNHCIG